MARTLFPHETEGQIDSPDAHSILDEMIYKGNRLAAVRKADLDHLQILFRELASRIERRGLQTLTLSSPNQPPNSQVPESRFIEAPPTSQAISVSASGDPPSDLPPMPTDLEFMENIGISSHEFHCIINQISHPGGLSTLDPGPSWKEPFLMRTGRTNPGDHSEDP